MGQGSSVKGQISHECMSEQTSKQTNTNNAHENSVFEYSVKT
jgi:hypothetical protein